MTSKDEKYKMLEYRLTDILEMNYSKHTDLLKKVKTELLSQPPKNSNLYPLDGFILDRSLVVIQNGHSKKVSELYLLNAREGSFEKVSIRDPLGGK